MKSGSKNTVYSSQGGKNMRKKHCEVVSNQEYIKVDIQEVLRSKKSIKQWAYILHDKDDTKPHYHIYLNFGKTSVEFADVANWFGVPENFVSEVKGRKTDMLLYLTHGNDSQTNKHQYDPKEVIANFDFEGEIAVSKVLGNFEKFSYAQQLQYVNSMSVSEKPKAYATLERLWKLHCQCLVLHPDRNIEVMFIHGKGGTGKTYYAKKLCEKLGYDYCISSSSNDPFQDYLGQTAMILDDLRDKAFEFEDLLKILDNNTASSVKSRFSNKVFNGKLIIITSTVPLSYWYPDHRCAGDDSLSQLYRRISSYVHVLEDTIRVYDTIDERGRPTGHPRVYWNDISSVRGTKKERTDFAAAFRSMLLDVEENVERLYMSNGEGFYEPT